VAFLASLVICLHVQDVTLPLPSHGHPLSACGSCTCKNKTFIGLGFFHHAIWFHLTALIYSDCFLVRLYSVVVSLGVHLNLHFVGHNLSPQRCFTKLSAYFVLLGLSTAYQWLLRSSKLTVEVLLNFISRILCTHIKDYYNSWRIDPHIIT
jgi:hypothetical protein